MKHTLLSLAILGLMIGLVSFNSARSEDVEVVTLKVESRDPGMVVEFEGKIVGDVPEHARSVERQATPFEMTVDSEYFHGLFHQLDGRGGLRVTLSTSRGAVQSNGSIAFVQMRGGHLLATQL